MGRGYLWAALALAFASCSGAEDAPRSSTLRAPLTSNPIAAENQLPGTADWHLNWWAGPHVLEAYAGEVSVEHGEAVDIHVSTDAPQGIHWELFRMGYYQGLGARLVTSGDSTASPQILPAANATTGLIECRWPTTFTIQTQPSWTSGVYVVRLTRADGPQQYATFVVRADEHKGAAVFQASVTTYQAYNDWGGESLYVDRALGLAGGHAREVSFNRPYTQGGGLGEFNRYEMYLVQWAEARGYDLTYLTDVDLDRDPSLLTGQKLFMSVGHDEYWSHNQRAAVEAAIAHGVNAAFFSGNAVYWQIRLEPSRADGTARRTEVCWKDDSNHGDPLYGQPTTTVMFREQPVGNPETSLMGVMYDAWQLSDSAWVVQNASNWVYAGTGVHDGDTIPLIVGYESDHIWNNGQTPSGLVTLSGEPALMQDGSPSTHNAALHTVGSGAFVFAAGSIQYTWGLAKPGIADARVQRMTANVLEHAGLVSSGAGESFGAGTWPTADLSAATGTVSTFAGSAFQTGLVDGPALQARFNRPLGAAVDGAGNVFIADTGNHVIRRIANDAAHTVSTIAGIGHPGTGGGGPGTDTGLWSPSAVAVAPNGDIYVADTDNERIVRIASGSWNVSVVAGSPIGEAGNADGLGTAARFANPNGLAFVGNDLYVADTANSRIRKIDPTGQVTTVAGTYDGYADGPGASAAFYRPANLFGADGALWVVDANNRLLRKVALDGAYTVSTVAGTSPGGFADGPALSAQLMPWFGIYEWNGTVYWTDTGNQRLRTVSDGVVRTLAGSGAEAATDGPAASAAFVLPSAVVPLHDGRLLIVDNGSSTLRVLDTGSPVGGSGTGGSGSAGATSSTTAGSSAASSTSGSVTSTSGTTTGGAATTSSTGGAATTSSTGGGSTSGGTATAGSTTTGSSGETSPVPPPPTPPSDNDDGGCGAAGGPADLALLALGLAWLERRRGGRR